MSELDDAVMRMRARAMTGSETPSITCPVCQRTSYNPNDVVHRYCGNCHQFHDNMSPALLSPDGVTYVDEVSRPARETTPPRLLRQPAGYVADFLYAVAAVGFFVGAKFGASWLWLLPLVPYGLVLVASRRSLSHTVTRLQELLERDRDQG